MGTVHIGKGVVTNHSKVKNKVAEQNAVVKQLVSNQIEVVKKEVVDNFVMPKIVKINIWHKIISYLKKLFKR